MSNFGHPLVKEFDYVIDRPYIMYGNGYIHGRRAANCSFRYSHGEL